MTNLIGIAGKKFSGKNAVATLLNTYLPAYQQRAFATALKVMVAAISGCNVADLDNQAFKASLSPITDVGHRLTYRQLLQETGDTNRAINPSVFIDRLFDSFIDGDRWIITDVRMENEAEAIRQRGGVLIRIERPGLAYDPHPSETALDNYAFDYVIENNGTLADLEEKVRVLINCLQTRHTQPDDCLI